MKPIPTTETEIKNIIKPFKPKILLDMKGSHIEY